MFHTAEEWDLNHEVALLRYFFVSFGYILMFFDFQLTTNLQLTNIKPTTRSPDLIIVGYFGRSYIQNNDDILKLDI